MLFMSELTNNMIDFWVVLVNEFAKHYNLTQKQAYRYISQHNGVEMFENCYGFLHTQSFHDMVDDMATYCKRMGGQL